MTRTVLALDIGGTKLAAALVDEAGRVLRRAERPTLAVVDGVPRPADAIFDGLAAAVVEVLADAGELSGIGIGSAGPIELQDGTVSPLNIPTWRRFPVVERIVALVRQSPASGLSPVLIGDGHCIALAEHWLGAGRGHASVIGCICSTGVGAGVVVDGIAYQGRTGNAAHVGHQCVDVEGRACACGSRGCVEALASGPSMVAIARERGWAGADARALTDDARRGDPVAAAVVDEGMRALAAGLAGLATSFDVPTVVVGGGVMQAGDVLLDPLRRHFADSCRLPYVADAAVVLPAALGADAGLLGAARTALRQVRTPGG